MKRFQSLLCVCVISAAGLASETALAHIGGHDDQEVLTQESVGALADRSLPQVIESRKLKPQWVMAQRQSVVQQKESGKTVWVVTYKNPSAKTGDLDAMLYVFFDDAGNFLEANHSGVLAGK